MAWVYGGICMLLLALTVANAAFFHCDRSVRIPWIPVPPVQKGIDLDEPWLSYPLPERQCCAVIDPAEEFDAQAKCSLCYNLTKSTPGYSADPNNCQNFVMCEAVYAEGAAPDAAPLSWNTFNMTCPNCTFWNQDLLTCVQVYYGTEEECGNFTHGTGPTQTPFEELPKIFCIDFEDQYQLADSGVYVFNDGVKRVNNALCPNVSSYCGHFLGSNSRLEVPFFSNNYDHFGSLRITMLYRRMGANAAEQGILSNDCSGGIAGRAGNSLFCSVHNGKFYAGVRRNQPPAAFAQIITNDGGNPVVYVEVNWDGAVFSVEMRANDKSGAVIGALTSQSFAGPIENSHCPLVIGSFIKDAMSSYFEGYMDDICFYKW